MLRKGNCCKLSTSKLNANSSAELRFSIANAPALLKEAEAALNDAKMKRRVEETYRVENAGMML